MSQYPPFNAAAFDYYRRLRRLREHVELHLAEPLSLANAAALLALNPQYFCTFFRKRTGTTFKRWITHLRVQRAVAILSERDASVSEAALAVGFRDLTTFERAFRRVMGVTPSTFQRSVRPLATAEPERGRSPAIGPPRAQVGSRAVSPTSMQRIEGPESEGEPSSDEVGSQPRRA